ncbi:rhodanese-like domain-containing protein [Streptomyces acidiscabies]|uniref:Rhodanese-like domain-containing protein n=1 Tax=Streptomyces acidiscabies TaxID=42234 RepID=A0AAP6BIB0_9ACTN|nr:rhodanese-like domain-containing protein [Streptomyces acidiscabies]MBP5942238.1 rhodanese-like domain-containing protein [Streptomyces sp. LBUM 1476]MBZ3913769.1 rhodanese-like domain-containing protein [Streptomyces acidiscabies]MDX2965244.1 rhodanese-like domain-containing protein [Streptomyces acidiscabies]MDX3022140.1 rhodanese-like domain-containing protein [Streptomyces acidiscabies]MDX3795403.1 rhodanese-like domain-containing protein [Streptomyces acidiscabies]
MVREATVDELAAVWTDGGLVVDVREPHEYAAGHVPGARLMPLHSVPARCDELPTDRAVFVICASGNRSRTAAGWMTSRGVDARSVTGGTLAWARGGHPIAAGSSEGAA